MPGSPDRVAVVDIGTNSTRLFIADVADGRVNRVERQSRVTRLGRGVDLSGQLSSEAIEATCEVIAEYVATCRDAGVERTDAIATSAVRDAENGDAFVAELRERFALSARVLDGEEEARLTYLGATVERASVESALVIDIGGGSTELIVGHGERIDFHTSLQAGVVRHTERHIAADPADHRGARGARRRRPHPDRGRPCRAAHPGALEGDRRRRHTDLAGGRRARARPLRPRARSRTRSRPARDPAPALAARGGAACRARRDRRPAPRTGRRRSSPAS